MINDKFNIDDLEQRLREVLGEGAGSGGSSPTPPSDMWARLEATIPDAADLAAYQVFENAEITPTQDIWSRIETELNDYQLTDDTMATTFAALQAHEATPKASIWEELNARLSSSDQAIEDKFATLQNFETPASAGIWGKMAAEMDAAVLAVEAEQTKAWAQFALLADTENTPTSDMWARIEGALPTETNGGAQFAAFASLATYEVTPEPKVWNAIAKVLDEESDEAAILMRRLRGLEKTPPAGAWGQISKNLPLNPVLSHHLTQLSRVAAVVLALFGATVLYQNFFTDKVERGVVAHVDTKGGDNVGDNKTKNTIIATQKDKLATIATTKKATQNGVANDINNTDKVVATQKNTTVISNNNANNSISEREVAGVDNAKNIGSNKIGNKVNITKNNINTAKANSSTYEDNSPEGLASAKNSTNKRENKGVNANNGNDNGTNDTNNGIAPLPVQPFVAQNTDLNKDFVALEILSSNAQKDMQAAIERSEAERELMNPSVGNTLNPSQFPNTIGDNITKIENANKLENERVANKYKGFSLSLTSSANMPFMFQDNAKEALTPVGGDVRYAPKLGSSFALGVSYQLNDKIGFLAELNRSTQGQGYVRATTGKTEYIDLTTQYNYVPLLMRVNMKASASNAIPAALRFTFGPQIGFLDQKTVSIQGDGAIDSKYILSTELGLAAGADYEVYLKPIKGFSISVGARTNYGRDASNVLNPNGTGNFNVGGRIGLNYRLSADAKKK